MPTTNLQLEDCCSQAELAESIAGVILGDLPLGAVDGMTADRYDGLVAIAHALVAEGKLDRAETMFSALLAYVPEDPYLHLALGSIAIERRRYGEAVPHLQRSAECDPSALLARCYLFESLLHHEVDLVDSDETVLPQALQVLDEIRHLDPGAKSPLARRAEQVAELLGLGLVDGVMEV